MSSIKPRMEVASGLGIRSKLIGWRVGGNRDPRLPMNLIAVSCIID